MPLLPLVSLRVPAQLMKDCKGASGCECQALDLSSGHDIDDFCKQVCL